MGKDFETEVTAELSGFSREDVCFFAWLCAVRALPFLAVRGNFDYWKHPNNRDQRQKHLFAILHALDNTVYYAADNAYSVSATFASTLASAAAYSARTSHTTSSADFYAASSASSVSSAAASAAASHARKPFSTTSAASAAALAVLAADSAYSAAVSADDVTYRLPLRDILLEDLQTLKNKDRKFQNKTTIYGPIWDSFQKVLRDFGCEYWGNWYAMVFAKGFVLDDDDRKEIKLRINVPDEISKQGAASVVKYLKNAKNQGITYAQRETRLIILGSPGAGKTTLARRLNQDFTDPKPEESTHGVDTTIVLNFNGVKTRVWDFGGQVIYHAAHRCFMSANCVYILVVNARIEEHNDIDRLDYWLDTIRSYSEGKAKVFIVINESDSRRQNLEEIKSKTTKYEDIEPEIHGFNISKDRHDLTKFKADLAAYIERVGHQTFGKNDDKAMQAIAKLFHDGKQVIEKDEFTKILNDNNINKHDYERVIELFDTLGVALSYNFMDGYVIDPYWISHGVYRVIDYLQEQKTPFLRYSEDVFNAMFKGETNKYSSQNREYIFKLMTHHEIGFPNKGGFNGLLVPCAASMSMPANAVSKCMLANVSNSAEHDSLRIRVEREDLKEIPGDFFYQYVCKNKEDIAEEQYERRAVWQDGMVLAGTNVGALVKIVANRRIEITVWGERKKEYLDVLEKRMDDLLKEYNLSATKAQQKIGEKIINILLVSWNIIGRVVINRDI